MSLRLVACNAQVVVFRLPDSAHDQAASGSSTPGTYPIHPRGTAAGSGTCVPVAQPLMDWPHAAWHVTVSRTKDWAYLTVCAHTKTSSEVGWCELWCTGSDSIGCTGLVL